MELPLLLALPLLAAGLTWVIGMRAPRLVVEGSEREQALRVIDHAIATRPAL